MKENSVSIWFLIGLQLAIYGMLITGSGLYQYFNPPAQPLILANLHAGIWWGALMGLVGVFYILKFRPRTVPRMKKV